MFSSEPRCIYGRSPLVEVICQIRFPRIGAINTTIRPEAFLNAVSEEFPEYTARTERANRVQIQGGKTVTESEDIVNHTFLSADHRWKLNLTQDFLAVSTPAYTRWEDFCRKLDAPLAQFLEVYQPSELSRVGLRYMNAVSRSRLGCEDQPWSELIMPSYLGILFEEDVSESNVQKMSNDVEMSLQGGAHLRMHAGPGLLQRGKEREKEARFILDIDLSAAGKLQTRQVTQTLEMLHQYADRVFNGAVTDELHNFMQPIE